MMKMPGRFKRALLMVLVIVLVIMIQPISAMAVRDGSSYILNQNSSTYDYKHGNGSTVKAVGCRLFSIAHALEWVNGKSYGSSIIKELANKVTTRAPGTDNKYFDSVITRVCF